MQKLVVIGAGMASGRVLEHLFEQAPDAYEVTLFNAEARGNYNRIMLSPVLSGEKSYAEIVTHDDDWYNGNKVTCRFGESVVGIDRARKVVIGENDEVAYDKLLIGTGCCAPTDTIALTRAALDAGFNQVLMLPPFYYKGVSDDGLFAAFSEVIEGVGDSRLKVYLYHFPQMSAAPIS